MPNPYDKTTHDGKTVDWITKCALLEAEIKLGYRLTVVQGSYHKGVSASAGTHDGGGCVDLAAWDHVRKVRVLRDLGFAVWWRQKLPGVWNEHIHGVLIGNDKLAPVAARQVTSYRNRRDGLAGNRADNTYHPTPIPTYQWPGSDGALALVKKAAAVLDKPATPTPAPKPRTGLRVDGIDLSHHNTVSQVQLNAAVKAGVRFVYLKATEGTTVKDATYANRRSMVRKAGALVGAYHFASPDKDGKDGAAEARAFLAAAKPAAGDMRPVLDLERNGGLPKAALTAWVGAFVNVVKAETGALPIIYTPFDLTDTFGCMLWVARYSDSNAEPKIPAPWKKWRIRQFSDGEHGNPRSIAGLKVDLNTLHDGEDLNWLRIPVKPVKEPAPKPPVVTPKPTPTPTPTTPASGSKPLVIQSVVTLSKGSSDHNPVLTTFTLNGTVHSSLQVNVQQTDTASLAVGHLHSVTDLAATGQRPDVVVVNELGTLLLQNAARDLPGYTSSHMYGSRTKKDDRNAVTILWDSAKFQAVDEKLLIVHGGLKGVTPLRVIRRVLLEDVATGDRFWRQGTHVVHHIEVGGKARVLGAITGQNARAQKHFGLLVDDVIDAARTAPVLGSGDLNVDALAEARLKPSERTRWFPLTQLSAHANLANPKTGTHGGRLIDWGWYRNSTKENAA